MKILKNLNNLKILDGLRRQLARLKILEFETPDSPLFDEYSPAAPTPPPLPGRGRRYTIFDFEDKEGNEGNEGNASENSIPNIDDHNLRRRSSVQLAAVKNLNKIQTERKFSIPSLKLRGPKLADHWESGGRFGRPGGRPSISLPGFANRQESLQSFENLNENRIADDRI